MNRTLLIGIVIAAAAGLVIILLLNKNNTQPTILRVGGVAPQNSLTATENAVASAVNAGLNVVNSVGNNTEGLLGVTPQASGSSTLVPAPQQTLIYGPTDSQLGLNNTNGSTIIADTDPDSSDVLGLSDDSTDDDYVFSV
jgi:hypothetical protein